MRFEGLHPRVVAQVDDIVHQRDLLASLVHVLGQRLLLAVQKRFAVRHVGSGTGVHVLADRIECEDVVHVVLDRVSIRGRGGFDNTDLLEVLGLPRDLTQFRRDFCDGPHLCDGLAHQFGVAGGLALEVHDACGVADIDDVVDQRNLL